MILKIYKVLIFCFILIFFNQSLALENKILFKINNEIISTIDLYNETKYLSLLNKDLTNLEKDKIFEISKNSLIREKIKEIELLKNYKTLNLDKKYFDQIMSNYSKKMGFENVKKFREYIEINGLNFKTIQNKIKIELNWNQLIVKKFLRDIKIDKKKIKEELTRDLTQKELLLSEIVFNIDAKSNLEKKLKLIQKDIKTNGFSNAALIHGISDTANNGGKLGWIKLSSLNAKIKNELKNIKVGNFSNPIVVPGGFLILKIVDERDVKKNLDKNKAIELAVNEKTNEQLNKLSIVYYNKIKKDIQINVL
jgi:peptidyl-prolyl cis-trans isomerase SurA